MLLCHKATEQQETQFDVTKNGIYSTHETNHVIADQHQQHSQQTAVSTAQMPHLIDREIRLNGYLWLKPKKCARTIEVLHKKKRCPFYLMFPCTFPSLSLTHTHYFKIFRSQTLRIQWIKAIKIGIKNWTFLRRLRRRLQLPNYQIKYCVFFAHLLPFAVRLSALIQ